MIFKKYEKFRMAAKCLYSAQLYQEAEQIYEMGGYFKEAGESAY